jgi:rod shape-determining protein MreC
MSLRNRDKKIKKMAALIIGCFFLFLFVFNNSFSFFISKTALIIAHPFLKLSNSLTEKGGLEEENFVLKQKINELEAKLILYENSEKEIANQDYLTAYILSRPPQSPYDILIIEAGFENGVQKNMEVTAYGSILLGYVSDVFPKISKVKLISFPKEETNAVFSSLNIPIIALGKGGDNLEINFPQSIEVNIGEKITTIGSNPALVGIVEKIEKSPAEPFQKILFRLPLNIQELKYVTIRK